MKILLIEDNAQNSEIFRRILNNHGHKEVVIKTTGLEGLEATHGDVFDAIFIDFDLPDLDGLQVGLSLYSRIRNKQMKPTLLIALTAQSDKATLQEAEQVGFDAFIGKPCTEADLVGALRQLAERNHAEDLPR